MSNIIASAHNPGNDRRYDPARCSLCSRGVDHTAAEHAAECRFTDDMRVDGLRCDLLAGGADPDTADAWARRRVAARRA